MTFRIGRPSGISQSEARSRPRETAATHNARLAKLPMDRYHSVFRKLDQILPTPPPANDNGVRVRRKAR